MFNIIRGDFGISKLPIDELKKEVNELRHNIEHTKNVLEDNVARVEENLEHIESRAQEMYDYQLDLAFAEAKIIDLEDLSKQNIFRIDGIKERPNETWEDCKNELHTLFEESLGIDKEIVIERVHRVKTDKSKKSYTPRTIVCRILNCKEKVIILANAKKLKGKNIFINEDFCQTTLDRPKELWKEIKR